MRRQTVSHLDPLLPFAEERLFSPSLFPSRGRKRTLSDVARPVLESVERWNGGIADEKERSERRNYRDMYGRFRSKGDNTRRKEFTDESGEIINRSAVGDLYIDGTRYDRHIDFFPMLESHW